MKLIYLVTALSACIAGQAQDLTSLKGKQLDSARRSLLQNDTIPKNVSLKDIVIKGKKPPVSFRIDRQVFQASAYANAANGSAVDLIKNLPSVSLNGQGEINVRGSSSFQVLVNGRPTQGDPAFVLGQIPASQIDNIELISSPGAAYDADGKSGIINIITKSAPEKGLVVQSNLMLGTPAINNFGNTRYEQLQRGAADVSVSFQKGRWDFSSGVNYLRNDMAGYREGDVNTTYANRFTTLPSTGERSFRRYNYGGRIGLAYEPNDKTRLESALYLGKRFQSRVADLLYDNTHKDLATGQVTSFRYFNENTQDKEGIFTLASIGSSHKLSRTTSLQFSAQYEGANLKGVTTNHNLSYPGLDIDYQETVNPSENPLKAYRLKADLVHRNGTKSLQGGYQFRYDTQEGDFRYLYRDYGSTAFVTDPAFTSTITVQNHIHALYAQYADEIGPFAYQGGLRMETMHRSLQTKASAGTQELDLVNLFPSALLRYKWNEKTTIKASYGRRIKRTNNFELNPIPEREHSETLEQGDPALLPELTGTFEAGIERRMGRGSLAFTLYHQQIKNPIQRVNKVYNDTILSRIYTNAGRALQTGAEASFSYKVGKAWQVILGGNVYKYRINGTLFGGTSELSNSSWVYSINSVQTFSIKENWSVQFSVNYLSRRATLQGEDDAFLSPNLAVKKTTKNNRVTFMAQWLHMDAGLGISNRQRISTWGADFYNTTLYIYEPDQLQFSVGFNLSRKNRKIILPQSEMAEKEF